MSKTKKVVKIIIAVILFAATFLLMYLSLAPKKYTLEVGQAAIEDIVAESTIIDETQTEKLRKLAQDKVDKVYDEIPGASDKIIGAAGIIMDIINQSDQKTSEQIQSDIKDATELSLDLTTVQSLVSLNAENRNNIKINIEAVLKEVYKEQITSENLNAKREYTYTAIDKTSLSGKNKTLAKAVVNKIMAVSYVENAEKTQLAIEKARAEVEPITYVKGSKIVAKGEVITDEKYQLLSANGLLDGNRLQDIILGGGIIFFTLTLLLMLAFYLYQFEKNIFNRTAKLFMILCQIIIYLALANLIAKVNPYLIPLSMLAITLSLVVKPKLALVINIFAVLLVAFAIKAETTLIILMITSGILSVIFMKRIMSQSAIYKYCFIIGIINSLIILTSDIMLYSLSITTAIKCAFVLGASIVSGFGSVGMVYLWEWVFNIPTSIRMLEMTSLNHPLVKKLMQNAPGTYQHSLNVSSMAEAAAEEIGADVLLAKAGGLFHDIGKLENPNYFSENQSPDNNPHDLLKPEESAEILRKHVHDGISLSKKYKLPKHIQNIIATHHGMSVMQYFYHKEKCFKENVDAQCYRYEGPKPVLKEAGIIMLADSCEAAVKSISKPNDAQINEMVEKIFKLRVSDNQLSESELTFAEINQIKKIFICNLNAMYHERIQYPQQDEKEEDKDVLADKSKELTDNKDVSKGDANENKDSAK
ncbi:MAG: HDIG domain-containing metalloprotein [Eubacteriaceae bacterium]